MASLVEIFNRSLKLLGADVITDISEDTKEAEACRTAWPTLRDSILRSHPWNCAIKRINLVQNVDEPLDDYKYSYQLPTNCLRVINTFPESRFSVEQNLILSNENELGIKYIFRQEDTTKYDPSLVEVFVYGLAAELCYQFTASTSREDSLMVKMEDRLAEARRNDGREGVIKDPRRSNWLRAKMGGS